MRTNRHIIAIMFFPVIVFLWLIGWSLYHTGDRTRRGRAFQRIDDGISIITGLYEEAVMEETD